MDVEVVNLKKYFGKTKAVDDISFTFSSGQIVGFVGPNGAGKTTTIKMMSTLNEPTSGDIFYDGVSVVEEPEKVRKLIGYMPDSLPTHNDIDVHEYLDFFARAYGIQGKQRDLVVEQVEEFTNLKGIRDKLLKTLSKGMKQRVSLARALLHDPSILIMDEPAAGLDPRARIELRELLKVLADQGKAIFLSSHILTELAEICDTAVIIEQGQLLSAGSLETLSENKQQHTTLLIRSMHSPEGLHTMLLQQPHVEDVKIQGKHVAVRVDGGDEVCHQLLRTMLANDIPIVEFQQQRSNLEEIFMNMTKGEVQ